MLAHSSARQSKLARLTFFMYTFFHVYIGASKLFGALHLCIAREGCTPRNRDEQKQGNHFFRSLSVSRDRGILIIKGLTACLVNTWAGEWEFAQGCL